MTKMLVLLIAALASAAPVAAQDRPASRWTSWIGCWQPVQAAPGSRVCVTQTAADTVTLRTTASGEPPVEQTIVADGAEHRATDGDCEGTSRAEWSADGERLFTRAALTCAGQARSVSGIATIAADGSWLDVQTATAAGRDSTRVRRYRRIADTVSAFTRRGRPLTLDAVKEASAKVSTPAVEALLAETGSRFSLNRRNVADLADAGVPSPLIDLMIALSYPKHFVVERSGRGPAVFSIEDDPYLLGWAFGCPVATSTFDVCPGSHYAGLYPSYFYTPFAYGADGGYYAYAEAPAGGSGGGPRSGSGTGQVIDGLGYTRVRPRDDGPSTAAASAGTGGTRRTASASPQGYSSGAAPAPAASSAPSSASSPSSGGEARTAVPR